MTSPRALASRSPILALLACVLAVASAAPTSAEERGTDLSAEVSAHARRLSETLRSSITPELISALGEGIAPGRPEPHVRGRSLADVGICEWVQKDADYDHAYGCLLRPSVVNDFKPETVKGRTGFEILKPIVTCLDVEDKEECQMRPSCIWYPAGGRYAEDTCDGDFGSILTAFIPANECAEDEKVHETMQSLFDRELVACLKFPTESECDNAAGLSCSWDPNEGQCSLDGITFVLDLIRSSAKDLHMIVALGRQADTCAVKTTKSDCDTVAACSWTSATSLCDVADSTVKSIVGVETLAGVFSTWNTCQIKSQSQCNSDVNCEWSNGNCEITDSKASEMLVDGMADGDFKTFISDGVPCTNSRATDGTMSTASHAACGLSSTSAGFCAAYDMFYHLVDGKYECFYWPNDPTWFNNILEAPYPGYDKRCPNVHEQSTSKRTACAAANSEAECGTGDYADCTWQEGSCQFPQDDIWKIILGDADGANLLSVMGDCQPQTNETACGTFERDIDFFSLKYPDQAKVKATLGFSGLTTMNAETAARIQAAVAAAVGGDVEGAEIAVSDIQFPVESKIELSISKSAVDANFTAFETKFKKGLAADLGVLPSDIVIKLVQDASSRRRRSLLSSNVEIDYEVNGAPDAVRAQTIAKTVQSSGGLSALKSSTDTTATVPAGTAPTYGLHVAVEPKTSDPRGVAARLDSATITVDGVTATHVTYASDDVEKKDDDTFMFGLTTLVFALICAGVALFVAILVCCVAVKMRRRSSSKVSSAPVPMRAGKDVEKA